jgi:Ca-activated chloride channel family protein
LLDELADSTGGRHFPVERLSDLAGIAERIGNQLRSEYVLGYSPQAARDGKYHRVTVELASPAELSPLAPLRVNYRRGFYGLGD